MKKNVKITISVLLVFIGICLISSTYFNSLKHEVFDDMNKLYYEEIVSLDPKVIEPEEETTTTKVVVEEKTTIPVTTTTTTKPIIDYSKYYIGYLRISKIKLNHGFTDKNNKYNNVNKNIYVHPTSTYPDVKNNNLILASHSGSSSISYFKNLYKLGLGDDVYISYGGKEYHYKIKKIYTDKKDGTVAIRRNKNVSTLTLITCTKNDKTTQTIYICELV